MGLAGLGLLASTKPFRCRLQTSEESISFETRQIVIANGRFFGVGVVGPGAHVDDHSLAVFAFGERNPLQFLKVWGAFLLGRHTSLQEANFFTTRQLLVEADPPQWISVDGEVAARTPATIKVANKALKILVPHGFEELLD